jgi:hypothetical protein
VKTHPDFVTIFSAATALAAERWQLMFSVPAQNPKNKIPTEMMNPRLVCRGMNADQENPGICMLRANQIIHLTLIRKPTLSKNCKERK